MVPGHREATVPPREWGGVGWGDSAEHSQRQAAHVGGGRMLLPMRRI